MADARNVENFEEVNMKEKNPQRDFEKLRSRAIELWFEKHESMSKAEYVTSSPR